jgi:hypothetical protein
MPFGVGAMMQRCNDEVLGNGGGEFVGHFDQICETFRPADGSIQVVRARPFDSYLASFPVLSHCVTRLDVPTLNESGL